MASHWKLSRVGESQPAFATDGYVVHRQLLEPNEVRHYRALLEALARSPSKAFRRGGGGFASAFPQHAPGDPAAVERGKALYGVNCNFCHGSDARGGEGGPNLLRSDLVLNDKNGELIATRPRTLLPGPGGDPQDFDPRV